MKYLSLFLLFWFSSTLGIEEQEESRCDYWNSYEAKSFSLSIRTSFHGRVEFELCNANKENNLYIYKRLLKRENEGTKTTETIIHEEISLSKLEYNEIYKRFQIALKYNTLDNTGAGRDGSYWCLESSHGLVSTYTKACFVTPSYKTKKRGLVGMHDLGIYLWSFSGLDNDKNLKLN